MPDSPGKQRLTKIQRQEVDKLVLHARLSHLTVPETRELIAEKLNLHLSDSWITHLRMKFKSDCKRKLKRLSLDRYEYISNYMELYEKTKNIEAHMWDELEHTERGYQRIICLTKLQDNVVLQVDLLEHLPAITTQQQNYDSAETSGFETMGKSTESEGQQQAPTKF